MADLVVVLGVIAFFAICALYVSACDWIIGPDPAPESGSDATPTGEETSATGAIR